MREENTLVLKKVTRGKCHRGIYMEVSCQLLIIVGSQKRGFFKMIGSTLREYRL
jgi:hypothetical protein